MWSLFLYFGDNVQLKPRDAVSIRREKRRVQVAICFASHWLKKWRKFFKPIVERGKCKRVIIFESHLKSTLKTHFPGISVTH